MLPNNKSLYHDLFGGQGQVEVWNLLGQRSAPPFSAVLWCELEERGVVGRHQQQRDPEIILCLEGIGRAMIGDKEHSLSSGVLLYLPHGAILSLENQSETERLRYLIIKAHQKR